jgi:hypothetical protein
LQRRDDASSVTTDVSLRTLGNRLSMVLMLVLFGASAAVLLIARAFKDDDPPVGPSREEPALAPADRRTITERHARRPGFGKRHA